MYQLGCAYHEKRGQVFFSEACAHVKQYPSEGAFAYLLGLLAHYCLDQHCHPLVYAATDNDELSHSTTVYKNRNGQFFGRVEDYNGDGVPDSVWGEDFNGKKLEIPNNQAVSDEETEDNSGKDAFNSFFGI